MIDDFVQPPRRPKDKTPDNQTNDPYIPDLSANASSNADTGFKTPEEVAAQDAAISDNAAPDQRPSSLEPDMHIDMAEKAPEKSTGLRWWQKPAHWFKGLDKKQKILVITGIILLLGGGGAGAYALLADKEEPKKPVAKSQPAPKKPTTVPSTLTGRQVDKSINERPVTAVMIENSLEARPQSGLLDAGVVFEAIAEGGITRFMALYQDTEPESIGPIRSVRPYYIDWALGFDAAIAHVGGSPEALQNIKDWKVKDLDQSFNAGAYQRVNSRFSPHNVYSSIAELNKLEGTKGYGAPTYTGFVRKADKPSATPNAKTINIAISSVKYNSSYTYDATTNSYLRNMAGTAHSDEKSGKQLNPKVVVALVTTYGIQADGKHSVYGTTGSGQAFIFQDGTVTQATWKKTDRNGQITFIDASGKPAGLNAGQTWLVAVDNPGKVTYQP